MQQTQSNLPTSSPIFPPIHPRPKILEDAKLRKQILSELQSDPGAWSTFQRLSRQDQNTFLDFCIGSNGLKATYDPFFKYLFSPERHPERLNSLLSNLLDQQVTVLSSLPVERSRISENSALTIMDLVVQLADGSLVNVEMQRSGYLFPIERCFCYGADLLMRQYDLTKETMGNQFSYKNLKPIYVIVLMEKSSSLFLQQPDKYIHRSQFLFDTGLKMKPLQNFCFISLDIFRQLHHNSDKDMTDLEAWLYFFSSDDSTHILNLVQRDENIGRNLFQSLYNDIANFRFKPKEMIAMFSEALSIMDRNTITLEIDSLKEELQGMQAELHSTETELQNTETRLQSAKTKLQSTETKLQSTETKLQSAETKLQSTETKLQSAETKLQSTETKLQSTETKLQSTETKLQSTETKLQSTENMLQSANEENKLKDEKIRQLLTKLAQYEQ